MKQLRIKFKNLQGALAAFKRSVDAFEDTKKGVRQDSEGFIRDSVIKRFELAIDTTWRYLEDYLTDVMGIALQKKGPKPILRECFKAGILTENETTQALAMVDSRNMTSHMYKEEVSDIISRETLSYYKLIEKIVAETKPS